MQNTSKISAKIISVVILLVLLCGKSKAQSIDLNNYQGLYSTGEIPKIIIKNIEKRIQEQEKKSIKKDDNWFDKRAKQRSIIERSFVISEILLGGNVIFNDTLSGYMKAIAGDILKDDQETLAKLHFFAVKSPYVNTICTEEGIVLVNTGLIARLKSEAQFAFILAREIAHFKLKHHPKLYLDNNISNLGAYNFKNVQDNLLQSTNFSIDQEIQADSMAMTLFAKSRYSSKFITNALNIFTESNAPVEQIPFDIRFFNTPTFKIPDTYFFLQVSPLEIDYRNASQPEINNRNTEINKLQNSAVDSFLNSKKQFLYCRDIARFDMCGEFLHTRQYAAAIYSSYVLLQKYPKNEYLLSNIAHSLYYLAKYQNKNIINQVNTPYQNIQGESQQLHLLFSVLKNEELNVLAINYLWNTYEEFPARNDLKKKAKELMNEMAKIYFTTNFSKTLPQPDSLSLRDSLNLIKKAEGKMKPNVYYGFGRRPADASKINTYYAFAHNFKNKEFTDAYNFSIAYRNQPNTSSINYYSSELLEYNPKTTPAMHLNKIVMVDPTYYKINNTFFVEKFNALESEKARKDYSKSIKDISKKAKLDVELLDSKFLNTKQVNLFNDISRLNSFIEELYLHHDLDSVLSSDYQLVDLLLQKHKTKYLAWNNVFALTEPDAMADPVNLIMYSVYLPPLAPYFLYDAFTPDYYTFHYMMVADIEKGKVIFNKSYQIVGKDTPDRLKSNLYYNFLQLGGSKEKKKK